LTAPLPEGWQQGLSDDGTPYHFNEETGESMWEHPMDGHYKELFQNAKLEAERQVMLETESTKEDGTITSDQLRVAAAKTSTVQIDPSSSTLLITQSFGRADLAEKLRVLFPGIPQFLIQLNSLYDEDEQDLKRKLFESIRAAYPNVGEHENYNIQMHTKQPDLCGKAYCSIADSTSDPKPFYNFDEHAKGGKLRCIPNTRTDDSISHLEMRGISISRVAVFNEEYEGSDSRQKQDKLLACFIIEGTGLTDDSDGQPLDGRLARLENSNMERAQWGSEIGSTKEYEIFYLPLPRPEKGWGERKSRRLLGKNLKHNRLQCKPGCSYVANTVAQHAGAPELMISYSWRLDWRYLVAFLMATFGPDVLVWIDILACAQLNIEEGDMSEIEQLPEVVNFAGKTVVMPGVLDRLWCICKCFVCVVAVLVYIKTPF
jgi:hypothetical protein